MEHGENWKNSGVGEVVQTGMPKQKLKKWTVKIDLGVKIEKLRMP